MTDQPHPHLSATEVAAYLDGGFDAPSRARLESHLADCPACRRELVAVSDLVTAADRRAARGRRVWPSLGVAAAAVMAVVFGRPLLDDTPRHRAGGQASTDVPVLVAPLGVVAEVGTFDWQPTTGADRYRVTVFREDGSVVARLDAQAPPTRMPDDVELLLDTPYLWQVEGRIDVDRWVQSELGRFWVSGRDPP